MGEGWRTVTLDREFIDGIRTLTFDCYGTLIDWESGIRAALSELGARSALSDAQRAELFDAYLAIEGEVQAGPYRTYRQVLIEVQARLAKRFSLDVPPGRREVLADSVPKWRPFRDTNAALARLAKRFQLGILSNIDDELLAQTLRHFEVDIDFCITAQQVGAYKPAHDHFLRAREFLGDVASGQMHVAQSVYHDGVPAAALGIPFIWINRRNETDVLTAKPLATLPDMAALADLL